MHALHDNTTAPWSGQAVGSKHPHPSKLTSRWARGRRDITPWAYGHLRALAVMRLTIAIFLTGVGAVLLAHGYPNWAAVPLAGAVLHFTIGGLDAAAARSAPSRT